MAANPTPQHAPVVQTEPTVQPEPVRGPVPVSQPGWRRLPQSWPARIIKNYILLPLVGALIAAMVIGRIADAFMGPKKYYVYVVGDKRNKSAHDMLEAASAGVFKSDLGDISVSTEIRDDSGDPDQAANIARELSGRRDVLMVVGHGNSTDTKRVLPVYMEADPPIPVLLTTETNPALLPPPAPDDDYVPPVFRLFPTDDNQAKTAADFIASQGASVVWVVEDTMNPTYSQYLARAFMNAVYDHHRSQKVILWSNNLSLPPYDVNNLGIDWVFFAGGWRNALVLIRQLKAMHGMQNTKVLLSDGSANKQLLEYGDSDVEGVYLLHPLAAEIFKNQGYGAVGKEAYGLIGELLDNVHQQFDDLATDQAPWGYRMRKWLGLHRVSDARRALSRFMAKSVNNQTAFNVGKDTIIMGRDENREIIRKDATFHVWTIRNNQFQ